jgi:hypothetical protein
MIDFPVSHFTALREEARPRAHDCAMHWILVCAAYYHQVGVFVVLHETQYAGVERAIGAVERNVSRVFADAVRKDYG